MAELKPASNPFLHELKIDAPTLARLKLWCKDAPAQDKPHRYRALYVREED